MEEKDINRVEAEQDVTPTEDVTTTVPESDPIDEAAADSPEKDSTVELREDYEKATAEQPKKKKKMPKKKLALIIVASVLAVILLAAGLFVLISKLLVQNFTVVTVNSPNTPPDVAVTYSAEEQALIESAMEDGASDETIKQAIAMIYAKANSNKINATAQAISVLQGKGSADAFGAVGSMVVRGIKVQAGTEFYYQKAAPIVECDPDLLQPTLSAILEQQERVYTNGTDIFRYTGTLKGSAAKIELDEVENPMTATVPFVPVGVPKKKFIQTAENKETFYEKGYYLQDPREITNFNITADYILLKDDWNDESNRPEGAAQEEESADKTIKRIELCQTPDGDRFYVCRFSLLIEGEGHDGCVQTARRYLRDSANSTDLEYQRFDVRLEVWENGFIKMMHDEEIWAGKAKNETTGLAADTTSTSWYESIIYYDFNADLFTEADAAEYKGDDWAAKIIAHYKAELDSAK